MEVPAQGLGVAPCPSHTQRISRAWPPPQGLWTWGPPAHGDSLYSSFTLVLLMECPSLDPTPACSLRATQYSGEAVREARVTAREHRVVHAASGLEWGQSSGPALHSLPLRAGPW